MFMPNSFRMTVCALLLVFFSFIPAMSMAAEATIDEAGIVFDLPDAWTYKTEQSKIPTGQLMQRWVRSPIEMKGGKALPGMVALATPVPKDANLVLLTQEVLSKEPYSVKTGSETECLKCVRYRARMPEGTITAFSFEPPPNCEESETPDSPEPCVYQKVNDVKLALEPSWAFRIEKEMPPGKMTILFIHALVDGKLLEVAFWYPTELAQSIEQEVIPIISSMRKR